MSRGMMVVALLTCSIVIGVLSYMSVQQTPEKSEQLVDKVFEEKMNQVDEVDEVGDVVDNISIDELTEIEPSDDPDPIIVTKENYTDDDISKLWFDVRDVELELDVRVQKVDILVEAIRQILNSGKTPTIAVSFYGSIIDHGDYGFAHIAYDYPNGMVDVMTMVLPDLGENVPRVKTFVSVNTDDYGIYTKVFEDIPILPSEYVTTTNDGSYITMSGSVVNERLHNLDDDQAVVTLKIEADKVSKVDLSSVADVIDSPFIEMQDEILFVRGDETAPYFYSVLLVENQLPNILYAVVPGEVPHTYEITIENGMPVIEEYLE